MAVHEVITDLYVELIPYNGFSPSQIVARATQVGGYPKYDQSSSAGKVRASRSSFPLLQSIMGYSPGDGGRLFRQRAGGNPSAAWSETESAFDSATGVLKVGESPRWNIYSGYSPGEWFLDFGALNFRFFRSENYVTNALKEYVCLPDKFFGYNHAAETPDFQVNESFIATDGALTVWFIILINEMKFPDTVTHILAEIVVETSTQTVLMALDSISNAGPVAAQPVVFSGVSANSGTATLFCSNSSGTKLASMGRVFSQKSFTITHHTAWNYLSHLVGSSLDDNVQIDGTVTSPSGTGNYPIYAGDNLYNVVIRINTALLQGSYTTAYFDLYLQSTLRSVFMGSFQVPIGTPYDIMKNSIVFNPALEGGESLSFVITGFTYS